MEIEKEIQRLEKQIEAQERAIKHITDAENSSCDTTDSGWKSRWVADINRFTSRFHGLTVKEPEIARALRELLDVVRAALHPLPPAAMVNFRPVDAYKRGGPSMQPFSPDSTIGEGIAEAAAKLNEENRTASKDSEKPEMGKRPATALELLRDEFKREVNAFEKCMSEARNYQAHIDVHRGQQKQWEAMATKHRDRSNKIQVAMNALEG
jgi:hypothetical protein